MQNNLEAIDKAIHFIEENLYEPMTVLDVAKSTSYSYYHFHRFFHSIMNETMGAYIRSRRLTQAAHDINHSKKSIIDISLSLGFETPESFTRAFKKRYSMTPSDYRKQGVDLLVGNRLPLCNFESIAEYKVEPEILNVVPTTIVGVRFPVSKVKDGFTGAWRLFQKKFQQNFIGKTNLYGIFETNERCEPKSFSLEHETNIFIGTNTFNDFSLKKYKTKILEGGKYAKFTYIGVVRDILKFYQYIWGVWFINSAYELDDREDFELYTERFMGEDNDKSEIDIYIPIK